MKGGGRIELHAKFSRWGVKRRLFALAQPGKLSRRGLCQFRHVEVHHPHSIHSDNRLNLSSRHRSEEFCQMLTTSWIGTLDMRQIGTPHHVADAQCMAQFNLVLGKEARHEILSMPLLHRRQLTVV